MTVNDSGKINKGGIMALKQISSIPSDQRTPRQVAYLKALLKELKVQPKHWEAYQDWGPGGPQRFLKERGIDLATVE